MNDLHGYVGTGWIGVDLDGTLACYDGWKGATVIGDPVPLMLDRVVKWVSEGREVRILTARVSPGKGDADVCRDAIEKWLAKHVYPKCPSWFREPRIIGIPITHEKDHRMIELWDDRCIQVVPNTGKRADGKEG